MRGLWVVSEELPVRVFGQAHDIVADPLVANDIVGGDANLRHSRRVDVIITNPDHMIRKSCLSVVAGLSPDESLDSHFHVAGLVHENGALAAELKCARSDVLGGRRADDLAHVPTPRVENVVELVS